eukprot:4306483-Amphidinium_carterae.1
MIWESVTSMRRLDIEPFAIEAMRPRVKTCQTTSAQSKTQIETLPPLNNSNKQSLSTNSRDEMWGGMVSVVLSGFGEELYC